LQEDFSDESFNFKLQNIALDFMGKMYYYFCEKVLVFFKEIG